MAILPYAVIVKRSDPTHLQSIQDWCFTQWPHTYRATWHEGWIIYPLIRGEPYTQIWSFQREADAKLFELTWS